MAQNSDAPQELEATVQTDHAVHLIFRVSNDWETAREEAVAEAERKIAGLLQYAGSPAFTQRHGKRLAVLRLVTARQPPSIVAAVLSDRGVEIEAEDRPRTDPGQTCALCHRQGLGEDQVLMTDDGWACPSCFRAWTRLRDAHQPQPLRLPSLSFIPQKVRVALLFLVLALCIVGAIYELMRMGQMSQSIRRSVPTE